MTENLAVTPESGKKVVATAAIRKAIHHDFFDLQFPIYEDEIGDYEEKDVASVAKKVSFFLDIAGAAFEAVKTRSEEEQKQAREELKKRREFDRVKV